MRVKIVNNFTAFFQSQFSFPSSQPPATFPCHEADRSCPPPPIIFFKLLFNIILSSPPRSSNRLFSLQFSNQSPVCIPRHPLCIPHARPISSFFIWILIIFGENYESWSSSLWNFLQSSFVSSLFAPTVFLSTLFSNILSLCSSRTVNDQVSCPCKTTGNFCATVPISSPA